MSAVSGSSGGGSGVSGFGSVGAPSAANSGGDGIGLGGTSYQDTFAMKRDDAESGKTMA